MEWVSRAGLCKPGQVELLFRVIERELGNIVTKNVAGPVVDILAVAYSWQRSLPIPGYCDPCPGR